MLREGVTFWYTILRGLWDFGYQLELNQEKQQKHLEQVSFTQKITQRSMGCNKFEENFHLNSNLTMPQRIPPVKKPLHYDTRGNSIRLHADLIGYRGNYARENPVNIMCGKIFHQRAFLTNCILREKHGERTKASEQNSTHTRAQVALTGEKP